MKKIPIVVIALIMISVGFLSGCNDAPSPFFPGEFIEKEGIHVSVYALAYVWPSNNQSTEGIQIRFDFTKTDGEDFTHFKTTDVHGQAFPPSVFYNVYEGQVIQVSASLMGTGEPRTRVESFTFENAKEAAKWGPGDTAQWAPEFFWYV